MMRFRGPSRAPAFGFDLTPMIDVVFLLIIFFLFTSQFAKAVRTSVDLPDQTGDTEAAASGDLSLDINIDGRMFFDGRPISMEQVVTVVRTHADRAGGAEAVQVLVRADHGASARVVNELAGRLAALGVRRWKLATAVPQEAR